MKQIALAPLFLVAIGLLGACSFGHKNFPQDNGSFKEPDDFVIQIDDYGAFWDPVVANRALDAVEVAAAKTNTIVVLFIHGWHHNAAIGDSNAEDFAESLHQIRVKLDDNPDGKPGPYRQSRERLTGDGDVKIIGIYIGWRGKSLPMPLNYLTFWGRKAAAERVGQGDLREFLLKLNGVYKNRNAVIPDGQKKLFMGMVSFGHSFGGQVLFRAVRGTLEDELIRATSRRLAGDQKQLDSLSGFGDMVVLINPALEALQYDRLHKLHKQLSYDRNQTPLLMVLSAETDFARQFFFPIGRWFDTLFRPSFRKGQRELWTQALGEYLPQRTHTVEIYLSEGSLLPGFDPAIYTENPCAIVNFDLTDVPQIGGVGLKPTGGHHRYNPFLVVYADSRVIIKHSGIFEKALRDFLNDYIAIAEGKRILLRDPKMRECPAP